MRVVLKREFASIACCAHVVRDSQLSQLSSRTKIALIMKMYISNGDKEKANGANEIEIG